ncbi:putative D-aminoacyl-tRNA deacylase [Blattamonas nauphoetae]|uniref:D-aminoacyl-tRNA deacylase n=1 Tax=Blattamonas nauphoetae TaxID=2049346 RepID=A0ABQ9XCV2_9EUKA|nr:putative D-aminoacyl-tRNA deacylase [Blattamonas nauphoetae]
MKIVIQKVSSADVVVDENVVGRVGKGYMCLVGICEEDTQEDADWICRKMLTLRLFEDGTNPWKKSIMEVDGELLLVSQFTLHARCNKGMKPDFHRAMGSERSKPFFEEFVEKVKSSYKPDKVQTGSFGAFMNVSLTNVGPITIILDSKDRV